MTDEVRSPPAARHDTPPVRSRVVLAATSGIFIQGFDWTLYGLLAPYLSAQLFPGSSPASTVVGAYAVFAAGFVARPFGSALMGRITDTRGRRAGLVTGVALIAAGSLLIAVVPGHHRIGTLAPLLVLLARMLQGIAYGGEVATTASYVVEVAPRERRHTVGVIAYSGDALGSLAAAGLLAALLGVLGRPAVEHGGWRIAFAAGALLGLAAWRIRRGVPESPAFGRTAGLPTVRPGPLLRAHAGRMLLVFVMTIGSTTGTYFATVYLPRFAAHTGAVSEADAAGLLPVALLVLLAAMLGSGPLADRYGPLALIRTGFTLLAVTSPPLLLGLLAHRVPYLVAATVFCLGLGLQLGVTPMAGARLFPVPIRAVALGVPAAFAIAGFGGTLPLLGEELARADLLPLVVLYVCTAVTASAVGAWLLRPTLLDDDPG